MIMSGSFSKLQFSPQNAPECTKLHHYFQIFWGGPQTPRHRLRACGARPRAFGAQKVRHEHSRPPSKVQHFKVGTGLKL